MHYILISMSIAPTYVSAFNKPSSGGQSFTYALKAETYVGAIDLLMRI
jgi:hypothetical protein